MVKNDIILKDVNKKKKILHITIILVLIIIVSIVAGILVFKEKNHGQISQPIGTVNNLTISTKLFNSKMNEKRAEIYSYFKLKYGVDDNKKFWTTSYGGEIPLVVEKEKALKDIVRIITQQELAKKKGVIDDISYEKVIKDCDQLNKKRKQDLAKGKVIYGPVEYSLDNYFTYVFSNMVINLKTKLGEKEFKLDDNVCVNKCTKLKKIVCINLLMVRAIKSLRM